MSDAPGHAHIAHAHAGHWLEHWDARARVLAALTLAVTIALCATLPAVAVGAVASGLLVLFGRIPARYVLARLRWLLLFVGPVALIVPFHAPPGAAPLFERWPGGPTDGGSWLAAVIALRILGASLAALVAIGVGPFDRTAKALQDLGLPRILVHMTLLAYRYLFIFEDDLARVRRALASRGFRPRASRATLATYGGVVGGLLVRSIDRTERLDQAMRCRGYAGELRALARPHLHASDVLVAAVVLVGAVAVGLVEAAVRMGWITWPTH